MTWIVEWPAAELLPVREDVGRAIGAPDGARPSAAIVALVEQAEHLFLASATPRGAILDIDVPAFTRLVDGTRSGSDRIPLDDIYPRSDALALYAATLGEEIGHAIGRAFSRDEPDLGFVLDAIAAAASSALSTRVADQVLARSRVRGLAQPGCWALAYSPGLCGWPLSSQRALFDRLQPDQSVGVTLNESCLMLPLKSVSGVVVVAPAAVHAVGTSYACCSACERRSCVERQAQCSSPGMGSAGVQAAGNARLAENAAS